MQSVQLLGRVPVTVLLFAAAVIVSAVIMKRSASSAFTSAKKFLRWGPAIPSVVGLSPTSLPAEGSSTYLRTKMPVRGFVAAASYRGGFTMDTLPDGHFHLGDNVFVTVGVYKGLLKIHIRVYSEEDGHFTPTKNGVVLTPRGWQSFAEALDMFKLKHKHEFQLVENELLVSSVCDSSKVFSYRLQRIFVKPNNCLQFYPTMTVLNGHNMDRLMDQRKDISKTVQNKLFGEILPQAILAEMGAKPNSLPNGEQKFLMDNLVCLLKKAIENNINELFVCDGCENNYANQLGHDCLTTSLCDRARQYFDLAIASVDVCALAKHFVDGNTQCSISNGFVITLDAETLIKAAKDLYVEPDICTICKDQIYNPKTLVCGHRFCTPCIDRWLEVDNTCPICRTILDIE